MKKLTRRILVAFALGAVAVGAFAPVVSPPAARAADEEKALCVVCQAKSGESEPETVVAWRTYEGKRWGFCSDECAAEFDADPASFLPPVLPRPAPEIGLTDLAGAPLTLEALEGKVVLVDFWATWCKPCTKSMPELQKLHERHAARGFTVVGVAIDEGDARRKVTKYLAGKKITYPNALDAAKDAAWERWRVKGIPAAFLLDRKGRIVAQWTGAVAPEAIERELAALLDAPKPD